MKTPVSELTLQQLALVLARDEYPDVKWNISITGIITTADKHLPFPEWDCRYFRLDWQTIGPIWEREFDNLVKYYRRHSFVEALAEMGAISKSPESIARALLTMWHPDGIEL